MSKKYGIILAVDPSGSFHEGKGTTGWCLMDADQNKIIKAGCIFARNYETKEDYWEAHIQLFIKLLQAYKRKPLVVIEDYILYASTAEAQINSRFETTKLIGILQYSLWKKHFPYVMQRAVDVKNRWTDDILEYKKYIKREGKHYTAAKVGINKHQLDSIRHAVHFNTFKNER